MKTLRSIKGMQRLSLRLLSEGKSIALVPTMGYLHEGHLSLISRAKRLADIVVTSVFVNPAQFGPREDLEKYPRDEKGDAKKAKAAGSDIFFLPKDDDIYPDGYDTYVRVEQLSRKLEGKSRPDHFRGVTTVVSKLFNIVRPNVALFGMKDFQQAQIIRKMTADLNYPVKIFIAPTVRENDGLAMSSRNRYLNDLARWEAVCLYNSLTTARQMVKSGILKISKIEAEMRAVINATCPTAKIDYIAFTDPETLEPCRTIVPGTVCSLAVKLHKVRLIDNMRLL